jgi:hypothetical protein
MTSLPPRILDQEIDILRIGSAEHAQHVELNELTSPWYKPVAMDGSHDRADFTRNH